MSRCAMPNGASASSTAWTIVGGAPIEPLSPIPFTSKRVRRGWRLLKLRPDVREGVCVRNGVIEQGAGQQLAAVAVVANLLVKRLADALDHAAMDLSGGEQRIDDRPGVVDGDVVEDLDHAGVGIDLDISDVHARRRAHAGRVVKQ